jgi:hypothetical protein
VRLPTLKKQSPGRSETRAGAVLQRERIGQRLHLPPVVADALIVEFDSGYV